MDEARKTNALRGAAFAAQYLDGRVIDIGAGRDLVSASAERFDIDDGDANFISRFRPAGAYDAVHSSHCLEHMHDPPAALREWWSLVKPGGYLILVVPDEDLYEQGIWPSIFNRDHKATFRLDKPDSWSAVSHDIGKLVAALPQCEVISAEVQDANYDYSLRMKHGDVRRKRAWWLRLGKSIGTRLPVVGDRLKIGFENLAARRGVPLDQTTREALAQIQVVARKLPA
ncbi:MAG: class I SAM-dependent methyltransferase [Betaproteobacteria bacterium]|nr:class I SAM-dependent methyltransferase [Betaproteobacteria bacterium]